MLLHMWPSGHTNDSIYINNFNSLIVLIFQPHKFQSRIPQPKSVFFGASALGSLYRIPMHSTTVAHPQTVSLGFRSFGDCEALFFGKSGKILKSMESDFLRRNRWKSPISAKIYQMFIKCSEIRKWRSLKVGTLLFVNKTPWWFGSYININLAMWRTDMDSATLITGAMPWRPPN